MQRFILSLWKKGRKASFCQAVAKVSKKYDNRCLLLKIIVSTVLQKPLCMVWASPSWVFGRSGCVKDACCVYWKATAAPLVPARRLIGIFETLLEIIEMTSMMVWVVFCIFVHIATANNCFALLYQVGFIDSHPNK